jgi:hypothetical protein
MQRYLPGDPGALAGDPDVRPDDAGSLASVVGLHDGAESAFDEAFLLTVGTGLGLWYATRKEKRDLTIRDGFLMVALVWTVLPVYAALAAGNQLDAQFYRRLF